jgi:integrase
LFTDKGIAALRPKAERYEKPEPGRSGLRLRVTPSGKKTWTFMYRVANAQKRMVLGHYPKMGVFAAHKALSEAKLKLQQNIDPGAIAAEERRQDRDADTITDLIDEYLSRHARKSMRPSSVSNDTWMLRREIEKEWGSRKAKSITRRDVVKLLDSIEDRPAPVLRNRVAGLLSRFFKFALDRGVIDGSPAVGIRKLTEIPRDTFLSADQIQSFWRELSKAQMTPAVRLALKFLLVTGQRRVEVAQAAWSEIDLVSKIWRLPASRSKNGRENLIPLPPLAIELLLEAEKLRVRPEPKVRKRIGRAVYDPAPSPWVFPSWHLNSSIEAAATTRALNRNRYVLGVGAATVHDLRRTFATWHGELGTAPEVLAALLNHTPVGITASVYNRSSLLGPRTSAMTNWCAFLQRIISNENIVENVIPLQRMSL